MALTLVCRRLGFDTSYGRGFDALPTEVHAVLSGSLVRHLGDAELLRCLAVVTTVLLRESPGAMDATDRLRIVLEDVVSDERMETRRE